MQRVLVIHGPNLNLIGVREPDIYGHVKLEAVDQALQSLAQELKLELEIFQSNHEGEIVECIQKSLGRADAIVINPAAYTHTSVAIADALKAVAIPAIEVHLSNIYAREPFRHVSTISGIVKGRIMGFGAESYLLALRAVKSLLTR